MYDVTTMVAVKAYRNTPVLYGDTLHVDRSGYYWFQVAGPTEYMTLWNLDTDLKVRIGRTSTMLALPAGTRLKLIHDEKTRELYETTLLVAV